MPRDLLFRGIFMFCGFIFALIDLFVVFETPNLDLATSYPYEPTKIYTSLQRSVDSD